MGIGHSAGRNGPAEVWSLGCRTGNFSGIDLYLAGIFGGEVVREGGLDGDLGYVALERDRNVGSLSCGGYGLGRGAAHQKAAGTLGSGGHLGEGAVINGGGGFLERQQSRFVGDIAYRSIGDRVKLDALAGCAFGKGESGFLGRDFRGGEVTPYDQAAVRVEAEQRDRRQRFLSYFSGGRGIEECAGLGRIFLGNERDAHVVVSGNGRRNFLLFLGARGEGQQSGQRIKNLFHDKEWIIMLHGSGERLRSKNMR